jgi:hypothetical protein
MVSQFNVHQPFAVSWYCCTVCGGQWWCIFIPSFISPSGWNDGHLSTGINKKLQSRYAVLNHETTGWAGGMIHRRPSSPFPCFAGFTYLQHEGLQRFALSP